MKQIIGFALTAVGAVATLWGGYQVLSGRSAERLELAPDVAVTAVNVGLIGILLLTLGLLRARD